MYVPCGYQSDEESKYERKLSFLDDLKSLLLKFQHDGVEFIVAGDLNIKVSITDSAEAYENRNNASFIEEWMEAQDKVLFRSILEETATDSFRYLNIGAREAYTCWNSGLNARVNNYGTRIDYVLISKSLEGLVLSSEILKNVYGSDHCPVSATFDISDLVSSKVVPSQCSMFFPELRGKQTTLNSLKKRPADLSGLSNQGVGSMSKKKKVEKTAQKPVQTKLSFFLTKGPSTKNNSNTKQIPDITIEKNGNSSSAKAKTGKSDMPYVLAGPKEVAGCGKVSVKSLLTGLPKAPLCPGHKLRCSLKTVTKDGENLGRRFYCCSLPIGPSSSKNSRCNFFKWFD